MDGSLGVWRNRGFEAEFSSDVEPARRRVPDVWLANQSGTLAAATEKQWMVEQAMTRQTLPLPVRRPMSSGPNVFQVAVQPVSLANSFTAACLRG